MLCSKSFSILPRLQLSRPQIARILQRSICGEEVSWESLENMFSKFLSRDSVGDTWAKSETL